MNLFWVVVASLGYVLWMSSAMRPPITRTFTSKEIKNNYNVDNSIGLLSGVNNVETSMYYSRKLDLEAASNFIKDKKYIYKSALKDADDNEAKLDEYLVHIREKSRNIFLDETVMGRDELKSTLKNIVDDDIGGTFACLLGGKNIGKSLVLRNMEKEYPSKVFVVDLRLNPDIPKGLLRVLWERKNDPFSMKIARLFIANPEPMNSDMPLFHGIYCENFNLRNPVYEMMEKMKEKITLVIDEANIAFTLSATADAKKLAAAKEALNLFTCLTKQNNQVR